MPLSFSNALSGLRANSEALGVTGNNISNSNTTAYKAGSINFADVYNDSLSARLNGAGLALQAGGGVHTAGVTTNFNQGLLEESGSTLNAGVKGNGYFVVTDRSGSQAYTRAGDFSLDREGYLVTPTGYRVQGYQAVNGVVPPDSPLTDLKAPLGEFVPPVATSKVAFRVNLSSTDAVDSKFHSPVQIYDSLGVAHTLDLTYTKTGDLTYTVSATLDGNDGMLNGGDTVDFTFDSDGKLTDPETLTFAADATMLDGATLPDVDIALFSTNPDGSKGPSFITNYDTASAVASSTNQNGSPSGTLAGLSYSADGSGTLLAVYSNGSTRPIGQLALATFNSQEGLRRLGDNLVSETLASGPPSVGAGGAGGRGEVTGAVLEKSNVDIAKEFTDLIVAQRSFQANSRVITTISQTLQDVIQII
jgi:flagellar hook protein FlgE